MPHLIRPIPLTVAALLLSGPVLAQKVDDNAVTQAADAFGINIDGENLGLYSPSGVRGFSPTAAGNIRLDGLYFDDAANLTNRLVSGYRIFVGGSVLGHPFPAPSGIADFTIRKPDRNILSADVNVDSFGGRFTEIDGQWRDALPHLGIAGGLGLYRYDQWYGGTSHVTSTALTARWRPDAEIELIPFWSRIEDDSDESIPILLLDGATPPTSGHAHRFTGQHWGKAHEISSNAGLIANAVLGDWRVRGGLFRSVDHIPINYQPTITDSGDVDKAARAMIAEKDQSADAVSGQIQASRIFPDGPRQHQLMIAAWARDHRRSYGATDSAPLAPAPIDDASFVPEPDFHFAAPTRDHVRQFTVGLAYQGSWKGVGELDLGIEKTQYRKAVVAPTGTLPTSRDAPWLFNASVAIQLAPTLSLYSGISRGLEESDVAPSIAVNRNEAPPAIRTRQIDAGARWALTPKMTLIAGVFRIDKPYYGLDGDRYFRRLGKIRHQGEEVSLSGSPLDGLSIVGGAVLLDASISGSEVASGAIGRRPAGSTPVTLIANADYRLPMAKAWSFDIGLERDGRRVVSVDDRVRLPTRNLIDLGMRYRFKMLGKPTVLRVQGQNITNNFSWDVVGASALMVHQPRQIYAKLTTDL